MSPLRLVIYVACAGVLIWAVVAARSPYRTALPMDTKDLSALEPPLARLKPGDRELVLGYLKRSHGDVLPARFADPDSPFTARTFSEAIVLQKDWLARDAVREQKAEAMKGVRDSKLAPLRAALSATMIKREIVQRGDLVAAPVQFPGAAKVASSSSRSAEPVLVVTYRITNASNSTLSAFKASAMIRKVHRGDAELGILSDCWLEENRLLQPGESIETRCGNIMQTAGSAAQAFVDMPETEFYLDWEPRLVQFPGGEELKFND